LNGLRSEVILVEVSICKPLNVEGKPGGGAVRRVDTLEYADQLENEFEPPIYLKFGEARISDQS
jgi:hypothetical protein